MTAPEFVPPFRQLVEGVADYLEAQGLEVAVARGWKARAQQINQGGGRANRVVFMPSKPDGAAGRIVGPRLAGVDLIEDPPEFAGRYLADWERPLVVSVWAFDATAPTDEGAQIDAAEVLFTWVQRAVAAVAAGNATWGAVRATVPAERSFGLELLAELTITTPIPDLYDVPAVPSPAITKGDSE